MSSSPSLILASASPRRQRLLAGLGLSFEIIVADVDETPLDGEEPSAMARRLTLPPDRAICDPLTSLT